MEMIRMSARKVTDPITIAMICCHDRLVLVDGAAHATKSVNVIIHCVSKNAHTLKQYSSKL